MASKAIKIALALALVIGGLALGSEIRERLRERERSAPSGGGRSLPTPVEVAAVRQGTIVHRRTFSGSLEAMEAFSVASRVPGRVESIAVDVGDPVERGLMIVQLEDEEYQQRVAQADAEVLVARATEKDRLSALTIADRAFQRMKVLRKEGVESESEFEEVLALSLTREAQLAVAEAGVTRAEAALEAENIRLAQTRVSAKWRGADETRVVGERFVDEGETISPNAPLLTILRIDPITAAIFVPERDYPRLEVGQSVSLRTDAYPERSFPGRVARIAPLFRRTTRQARVEVAIPNGDHRLRPGMFVRVTLDLDRKRDATIVPIAALTRRNDQSGLFLLDEAGEKALWRRVRVGIRENDEVAVEGEGIAGRVVTLGQQLLDDGADIVIPAAMRAPTE